MYNSKELKKKIDFDRYLSLLDNDFNYYDFDKRVKNEQACSSLFKDVMEYNFFKFKETSWNTKEDIRLEYENKNIKFFFCINCEKKIVLYFNIFADKFEIQNSFKFTSYKKLGEFIINENNNYLKFLNDLGMSKLDYKNVIKNSYLKNIFNVKTHTISMSSGNRILVENFFNPKKFSNYFNL